MTDTENSEAALGSDAGRAYDTIADLYAGPEPAEEDAEWRARQRDWFCNALVGRDVLEVGCGPGVDALHLAGAGLEVTGIDLAPRFIEIATERVPNARFHVMDMGALTFADGSFDGIYAFASLLHIAHERLDHVLEGFARVLRPGGVLFSMLIKSDRVDSYTVENWGSVGGNALEFYCHAPERMVSRLTRFGFTQIEISDETSAVYGTREDLRARGVMGYQLLARYEAQSGVCVG